MTTLHAILHVVALLAFLSSEGAKVRECEAGDVAACVEAARPFLADDPMREGR